MKERPRRASRRITSARRLPEHTPTTRGQLRDTPLSEAIVALKDTRLDAIDALSDDQWAVYVDIATTIFGLDAARLAVAEALRITRASAEAA